MLDIGWWELFVVGMVALVVVGPKELPTLLRTIGRYVGMAKRQADEFRSQFDEAMRESEFSELRKEMDDIKSGVTASIDDAQNSLNKEIGDINSSNSGDKGNGDEYDWDADGPIKPAPEFADDEPTTSFTMPDGEVVKKKDDGEVVRKQADGVNSTAAKDADATEPAATGAAETSSPSGADSASKDAETDKVAPTQSAETVR
jgi:sec-independent protein translocase protein TatB